MSDSPAKLSGTACAGVIALSGDGRILDWDSEAARIFGWSREDALQQPLAELILARPGRPALRELLRRLGTEGAPLIDRLETPALRREGQEFSLELILTPLRRGRDSVLRGFVRDLSARHQMDQMKDEFVSMVSHELRTPLTSIRGSLGLLSGGVSGALPPHAKAMIEIAYRNSDRLIRLVNDILDIEKIESGKMTFSFKESELAPFITQAIEATRSYAALFDVTVRIAGDAPQARARVDSDRLIQVLTNLISNAVKFSPPKGSVDVFLVCSGEDLEVRVTDHGAGIPEAFQPRIFQKFAQADGSDSRKVAGTGLGLSICKSIIERMNGTIGFTTQAGQGTTFFFKLPLAASEPVLAEARPLVLHVEDDSLTREAVKAMLSEAADVIFAETIESATRCIRENSPDLIILDISLPDGDGLDLLPVIAECSETPPPVMLFTGGEIPPFLSRLVEASHSKFSTDRTELLHSVRTLLASRPLAAVV